MRRSGILLLCLLLATATGLALLGIGLTLAAPTPRVAPSNGSPLVLDAFVAALNDALRTGDDGPLRAATAPGFVDHGPMPGAETDLDGLMDSLHALRATYPGLRLSVEEQRVAGDRIFARVAARGQRRPSFLGLTLPPEAAAWSTLELLRIEDGKIAERWNDAGPVDLYQPLTGRPLEVHLGGREVVTLARLTLSADASISWLPLSGPALVVVERGAVAVRAIAGWEVERGGGEDEPVESGREEVLNAGDAARLSGTEVVLRGGAVPASVLVATVITRPAEEAVDTMPSTAGFSVEPLLRVVGTKLPLSTGTVEMGLGRAVVHAGGSLPLPDGGRAVGFTVEDGALGIASANATALLPSADGITHPPSEPADWILEAGDGVVFGATAFGLSTRVVGDVPARVLMLVLTPVGEAS
jgi:predicted ester cyclase